MSRYRMSWPILDPRVPLADLLGHALLELRAGVDAEDSRTAGPVSWEIDVAHGRPRLIAEVDVITAEDDEVAARELEAEARRLEAEVAAADKARQAAVEREAAARVRELKLRPCGTHAAFTRHKDRGEPVDELCADAERDYQAIRHLRRRARLEAAS